MAWHKGCANLSFYGLLIGQGNLDSEMVKISLIYLWTWKPSLKYADALTLGILNFFESSSFLDEEEELEDDDLDEVSLLLILVAGRITSSFLIWPGLQI